MGVKGVRPTVFAAAAALSCGGRGLESPAGILTADGAELEDVERVVERVVVVVRARTCC